MLWWISFIIFIDINLYIKSAVMDSWHQMVWQLGCSAGRAKPACILTKCDVLATITVYW